MSHCREGNGGRTTPTLPIDLFFEAAERAVTRVIAEMSEEERAKPHRTGGRLTVGVTTALNRLVLYGPEKMGELTDERDALVTYFSAEKAMRLFIHCGDSSSRQSRDVAAKQYAGALRFGIYIISFSGFCEEDDEKVARYTWEEVQKLASALPAAA